MNASVSPFIEHRDDPRVAAHTSIRLEAPKAVFPKAGPAVIEEISACGLRVRSETQLHPDEELVLKVKGELPLHARAVWVREALPRHHGSHKMWIAGCRFHGDSIAKVRLEPDALPRRTFFLGRKALLAAGVIGLVALLVYLYLHFALTIGGTLIH